MCCKHCNGQYQIAATRSRDRAGARDDKRHAERDGQRRRSGSECRRCRQRSEQSDRQVKRAKWVKQRQPL